MVGELEGLTPSRPPRPREGKVVCQLLRIAALRALHCRAAPANSSIAEGLRSTPFDGVPIAPCCFAERKAVLSHALAALTALKAREKTEVLLHAKHALTALKVCEKA